MHSHIKPLVRFFFFNKKKKKPVELVASEVKKDKRW